MKRLYGQDRAEFVIALITLSGVVVFGMLVGILSAVFLSLALLIARISRPRDAAIGSVEGAPGFHELEGDRLEAAPGVLVYRFDGPLFFANAEYFVDQVIEIFDRAASRRLVLDFEAVTMVDVTAARALKRLLKHLEHEGAELSLARTRRVVIEQMAEAGLVAKIGEAEFFSSLTVAVEHPEATPTRWFA